MEILLCHWNFRLFSYIDPAFVYTAYLVRVVRKLELRGGVVPGQVTNLSQG